MFVHLDVMLVVGPREYYQRCVPAKMALTTFSSGVYYSRPASSEATASQGLTFMMKSTRFYYFAFTFRFSFGEGRLRRSARASDG
jgi:hypothetical protein